MDDKVLGNCSGKANTAVVTWSDGVTGRDEEIDSKKTNTSQGKESPSVFASSTDRLHEVVVQGIITS